MSHDITIEQWLHSLEEAQRASGDDAAVTVIEIAERTGHAPAWVRQRLGESQRRGDIVLEPTRVWRTALDGTSRPVPAYRIRVVRASAA